MQDRLFRALAGAAAGCLLAACSEDGAHFRIHGDETVVGVPETVRVDRPTPAAELARRFGVGARELARANPQLGHGSAPAGSEVLVPTEYVLPPAPRRGIVVNIAEMRLYFFPGDGDRASREVLTFPVAIGRDEWETPTGQTQVIERIENPEWRPPGSIKADEASKGRDLPDVIPPGPDNPLGKYALRLGWRTHLIHGTNDPYSVGKAATHGCIRLYPEDMAVLYKQVKEGTPVTLIDAPYKFGVRDGDLYVEAHPPSDDADTEALRDQFMHDLAVYLRDHRDLHANWAAVVRALTVSSGIPARVSST